MRRINYPKKYINNDSASNSKKSFTHKNNISSTLKDSRQKRIETSTPTRSLEKKYFFSKNIKSGSKSKPNLNNYSKQSSNSKSYMNIFDSEHHSLSIQNKKRTASTF